MKEAMTKHRAIIKKKSREILLLSYREEGLDLAWTDLAMNASVISWFFAAS